MKKNYSYNYKLNHVIEREGTLPLTKLDKDYINSKITFNKIDTGFYPKITQH
jgi:hypothetical protein